MPTLLCTERTTYRSRDNKMQEVVVTGYQNVDRKLFTGATGKVNAKEAERSGVPDVIAHAAKARWPEYRYKTYPALLAQPQDPCTRRHFPFR